MNFMIINDLVINLVRAYFNFRVKVQYFIFFRMASIEKLTGKTDRSNATEEEQTIFPLHPSSGWERGAGKKGNKSSSIFSLT